MSEIVTAYQAARSALEARKAEITAELAQINTQLGRKRRVNLSREMAPYKPKVPAAIELSEQK